MRRLLRAVWLVALLGAGGNTTAGTADIKAPDFASLKAFTHGGDQFVVYGDARGIVHVRQRDSTGTVEEWTSAPLESSIGGVFCEDLDQDGTLEALAYTGTGSIALFDIKARRRIWSNDPEEFGTIVSMAVANTDDDPQKEIIFCADSRLHVYDSQTQLREWTSNREFEAQDIQIGDVDDDGQLEIVLNTGYVLDAQFHDLEWQTERFGDRIRLFDLDDDGVLELVGEFASGVIRVYDMDLGREKW